MIIIPVAGILITMMMPLAGLAYRVKDLEIKIELLNNALSKVQSCSTYQAVMTPEGYATTVCVR